MINLIINKLLPFIVPYKLKIFGAVLLSLVLAAIGGFQISLIKPLFDKGLSADGTPEEAYIIAAKLLALGLLNFPCRFFHFYWIRFITEKATCAVREKTFKKLLQLPTAFYGKAKQGQLISSIINDSVVFSHGFRATIDLIREPLKAVVYIGMAFWADWQLTIVILVIAPFLIAIFSISGKKVRKNQAFVQEEYGEFTHNISEGISAHKITKAFNLQNFISKRFNKAQDNYFVSQMRTIFVEEMAHPFVEVVGACAFAGVVVFAHHRIASGATTTGEFISFIAALALFMDPIRKFSQGNVKLAQAQAASDRIYEILDLEEEEDFGKIELSEFKDCIEIRDLTFSYGEGDVISNFSIKIKKGQKVALVGLSGSGKSTLINLFLRLYAVEKNKIFIDGNPIENISLKSLRNVFGLVSQDIFLFHDTISENLNIGGKFSDQDIDHALEVAYAREFIAKLPEGAKTIIGDRGTRLSGGQQQRLTIARAFLQNTDVLLFDEATSALDNESEKVVQQALEGIGSKKTVIAVAHRLSTIQDYDQIFVLKEGRLVEQGQHSDLIFKNGEYAKLYDLSRLTSNKK